MCCCPVFLCSLLVTTFTSCCYPHCRLAQTAVWPVPGAADCSLCMDCSQLPPCCSLTLPSCSQPCRAICAMCALSWYSLHLATFLESRRVFQWNKYHLYHLFKKHPKGKWHVNKHIRSIYLYSKIVLRRSWILRWVLSKMKINLKELQSISVTTNNLLLRSPYDAQMSNHVTNVVLVL